MIQQDVKKSVNVAICPNCRKVLNCFNSCNRLNGFDRYCLCDECTKGYLEFDMHLKIGLVSVFLDWISLKCELLTDESKELVKKRLVIKKLMYSAEHEE